MVISESQIAWLLKFARKHTPVFDIYRHSKIELASKKPHQKSMPPGLEKSTNQLPSHSKQGTSGGVI